MSERSKINGLAEDLAVAFAMRVDQAGLTVEAGKMYAEEVADRILGAAEDRENYAPREEEE